MQKQQIFEIFAETANMSGSCRGACWFLAVVVGKKTLDMMARDTSNFPQGEIIKKEQKEKKTYFEPSFFGSLMTGGAKFAIEWV